MAKGFNPARVPTSPVAASPHLRPDNTDPRVDGPYLDDVHAEQENAYREGRNMVDSRRNKDSNRRDPKSRTAPSLVTEWTERDVRSLDEEEQELVGTYSDTGADSSTKSQSSTRSKTNRKTSRSAGRAKDRAKAQASSEKQSKKNARKAT